MRLISHPQPRPRAQMRVRSERPSGVKFKEALHLKVMQVRGQPPENEGLLKSHASLAAPSSWSCLDHPAMLTGSGVCILLCQPLPLGPPCPALLRTQPEPAAQGAPSPWPQAGPGEVRTRCPQGFGIPGPTTAAPVTVCFFLSGAEAGSFQPHAPRSLTTSGHQHPLKDLGLGIQDFLSSSDPKCRPRGFLVDSAAPGSCVRPFPGCPCVWAGEGPLSRLLTTPSTPQSTQSSLPNLPLFIFPGLAAAASLLCASSSVERTSDVYFLFVTIMTLQGRYYCHCFTGGVTEAQRGEGVCPKSQSKAMAELRFKPKSSPDSSHCLSEFTSSYLIPATSYFLAPSSVFLEDL